MTSCRIPLIQDFGRAMQAKLRAQRKTLAKMVKAEAYGPGNKDWEADDVFIAGCTAAGFVSVRDWDERQETRMPRSRPAREWR